MSYCKNCGNPIAEDQAFCGKCGSAQNTDAVAGNNPSFFRFVRGIPFLLVFFAFLLPLVVVSCPETDTELARYSTYETMDLAHSAQNLVGYLGGLSALSEAGEGVDSAEIREVQSAFSKFTALCVVLFVLSAFAFGLSFFKKRLAACFGFAGAIVFIVLVSKLCSPVDPSVAVRPGAGFWTGLALYLAGIVLNLVSRER